MCKKKPTPTQTPGERCQWCRQPSSADKLTLRFFEGHIWIWDTFATDGVYLYICDDCLWRYRFFGDAIREFEEAKRAEFEQARAAYLSQKKK